MGTREEIRVNRTADSVKQEGGGGMGQKGPACPEPVGGLPQARGLESRSPPTEEKNAFMPRRPGSLMTKVNLSLPPMKNQS